MSESKQISTDVLVAGGGMAGVCAALAAARNGSKVVLCQDRPVLGGNASSEICMHICGADAEGYRGVELETEVREGGIIEEIRLDCMALNPQFSPTLFDLILYDKCRNEENLTLMLNTALTGAEMDGTKIVSAYAQSNVIEEKFHINADIFIDCTGDGRLGFEADAKFMQGRESKEEFNESRALDCRDDLHLGSSLLFRAKDTGEAVDFVAPNWAKRFSEEDLELRDHSDFEFGYWWIEYGGCLDSIKANEIVRDELLAILMGVWDHIKNSGNHPESKTWTLDWIGFLPGKRESRRFVGKYILNQNDLENAVDFRDSIAHGGWSLDTHPPQGIYAKKVSPCNQPYTENIYSIPLACCISDNIDNLMFAGRNISATHIAFASTRVMATCAVLGQSVGTFAAICSQRNLNVSTAHDDVRIIHELQQILLMQDVYIPGKRLADRIKPDFCNSEKNPAEYLEECDFVMGAGEYNLLATQKMVHDLARLAKISCSSQQDTGKAVNVIDGYTRSDYGLHGARSDISVIGTHRWMSNPEDSKPWIKFEWDNPVDIKGISMFFDTGMHRPLMMTPKKAVLEKMVRGPQPETIKDFKLYADVGQGEQVVLDVKNNYQRMRDFEVWLFNVISLRFEILSTHGLDHARLFSVMCC